MNRNFNRLTSWSPLHLCFVLILNITMTPICALAGRPGDWNIQRQDKYGTSAGSTLSSPSPTPLPTPLNFLIAPASGVQGKEYEVIVQSKAKPTPTPNVTLPANTQPACDQPMNELQLYAPAGSGVTVVNLKQTDCRITAKLSIAADAPLGVVKIWLVGTKDQLPKDTIDFSVTGLAAGPIPPGLNNQGEVDVMWSVLPDQITNDNFGGKVARQFYCIEAVIGNDSGYDLQLSSIGFTLPFVTNNKQPIPSTGYRVVRGSLEEFGQVAPRKFVIGGLKMLGPILTGFLPFFHVEVHKANFSSAINLISNPIEKGLDNIWPDLLPTHLDRLADQTFRDDISTKTVIPNNVQSRILTFVPKRLVFSWPAKKLEQKTALEIMTNLGEMVIVGKQITYVNRVRVANNAFGTSITDHSISGKITDLCGRAVANVTMMLTADGFDTRTVKTNSDGSYTFSNVPDGRRYVVTPSLDDSKLLGGPLTFTPTATDPFLLNDTHTADFSANQNIVQGKIVSNDSGLSGVTVKITGLAHAYLTEADGKFQFAVGDVTGLTVTPEKAGFKFSPTSASLSCPDKEPTFEGSTPTPSPTPKVSSSP